MTPRDASQRSRCEQCGTCCHKGGPALHNEDIPLFTAQILGPDTVVTLRQGELVHDQLAGDLLPLPHELLKLMGPGPGWRCPFLKQDNSCGIYDDRPTECRALACWDTTGLAGMYDKDRITRRHVIPPTSWIWDLIETHDQRCDYARLSDLAADIESDAGTGQTPSSGFRLRGPAAEAFLEAVRYDAALRELVHERAHIPLRETHFYFGRPLTQTIIQFGLKTGRRGGGEILLRAPIAARTND